MPDSKRDARRTSDYISASNANYARPWQPMKPSAPPTQSPHPTLARIPASRGAYRPLPTPNANNAQQSASSSSQAQGPRHPPTTDQPNYAHPDPIDYWCCCHCKNINILPNCPELCALCPHMKCPFCSLDPTNPLESL